MNYTTIEKMQNNINAIGQNLLQNVAGELLSALSEGSLAKGEKLCQEFGNKLSRELLSLSLNTVDNEIAKNISRIDYKKVSRESRSIQSIFGGVTFSRYRYKTLRDDALQAFVYPLDERIGLVQKARISPLLTQVAAGK